MPKNTQKVTPSLAGLALVVVSLFLVATLLLFGRHSEALDAIALACIGLYAVSLYHFLIEKK